MSAVCGWCWPNPVLKSWPSCICDEDCASPWCDRSPQPQTVGFATVYGMPRFGEA